MEYPLWVFLAVFSVLFSAVLILLLMEYPFWGRIMCHLTRILMGLNPSSNGIPALGRTLYCNRNQGKRVLILLLMEYPFWDGFVSTVQRPKSKVLILLLMEYPLGRKQHIYENPLCEVS